MEGKVVIPLIPNEVTPWLTAANAYSGRCIRSYVKVVRGGRKIDLSGQAFHCSRH